MVPILVFLIITLFSDSASTYNMYIYTFFILILGTRIVRNAFLYFKTKRGTICQGEVIDSISNNDHSSEEYKIKVRITSPSNREEYVIYYSVQKFPSTRFVDILFDTRNPGKSVLLNKISLYENLFIMGAMIFFVYKLLTL